MSNLTIFGLYEKLKDLQRNLKLVYWFHDLGVSNWEINGPIIKKIKEEAKDILNELKVKEID